MAATSLDNAEVLSRLVENVNSSYTYFKDNYLTFNNFRRYVFKSSIDANQRTVLNQLSKPVIEFNILEAYVSRWLGEFAQHEPGIIVRPSEGVPVNQETLDTVEGYFRHLLHEANKNGFEYEVYKDQLSGGFGVAKVWTDYSDPMSFNQQINIGKVFDATLVGFDPLARTPHKGDGKYSFEVYPMLEEDFKVQFPNIPIENIVYSREIQGFQWAYKNMQGKKIILVCDYFEKVLKRTKIVKLANGRSMTAKNYKKLQEYWEREKFIEQIPIIVNERTTMLETIHHYFFTQDHVIKNEQTDYTYLPHVFFDCNSITLSEESSGNSFQMTRPAMYQAKGTQDMINFAGQTICNNMENLTQSKFIVMKEAIPQEEDYLDALTDLQQQNTIVVNAYSENNPDKPIPNPIREVQHAPLPGEVISAFQMSGPMVQTILGGFSSNAGRTDNDLSGKAVIELTSVGNAAAMPPVIGHLAGLTQIANIVVDLMPKYLLGKRTIPVSSKSGQIDYQEINSPGNPFIDYDEKSIKVNVEAGVNFQVQKNQALQQITSLMGASQEFNQFMNSPKGLEVLVKNLTCYGADQLQEAVPEWTQQQQQMQQQAQQSDPKIMMMQAQLQVEQQKVAIEQQKGQLKEMELQMKQQSQALQAQLDIAKLAIEKQLADAKILESEAKVSQAQIDSAVRLEESQTSLEVHALEAASKMAEIHSREHDKALKTHASHLAERKLEHEINKVENKDVGKIQD